MDELREGMPTVEDLGSEETLHETGTTMQAVRPSLSQMDGSGRVISETEYSRSQEDNLGSLKADISHMSSRLDLLLAHLAKASGLGHGDGGQPPTLLKDTDPPQSEEGDTDAVTRVKDSTSDQTGSAREESGGSTEETGEPSSTERRSYIPTRADEDWMHQLAHTLSLPRDHPPTFSGTSRKEYGLFIREFQHYLTDNRVAEAAKLRVLIRSCTGDLKKSLMSYLKLDPKSGYEQAKAMLDERLGDEEEQIEDALYGLAQGPEVSGENIKVMQKLVDGLWDCIIDYKNCGRIAVIDNFYIVTSIARRFSGGLLDHYYVQLNKYRLAYKEKPGIEWFRKFLSAATERLRGRERKQSSAQPSTSKAVPGTSQAMKGWVHERRAIGLATTTGDAENWVHENQAIGLATTTGDAGAKGTTRTSNTSCPLCKSDGRVSSHPIYACSTFKNMTIPTRKVWVTKLRLCFNCLKANHVVRDCRTGALCTAEGCRAKHSSWLHPNQPMHKPQGRTQATSCTTSSSNDLRHTLNMNMKRERGYERGGAQEHEPQPKRLNTTRDEED